MIINIFFVLILLLIIVLIANAITFKHETYYKITGNSFFQTIFDTGKHGEYLTYKKLKEYEADGGKFLFNCYLPKEDGKTTEIDVLLIHSTGIFVIESKNYSGWIYGRESDKTWTQTLLTGNRKVHKEHFYNPIMQNSTHVKWLREIVGTNIPIYSVIAFSERCTLKDIPVESSDIVVINRQDISQSVKYMGNRSIQALSKMDISRIEEMLYPYTQTTEYEKQQHIDNIKTARYKTKKKATDTIVSESSSDANNVSETASNSTPVENTAQENAPQENNVNQNSNQICPRCGADLVLRTAKKGEHSGEQFYGCSRFPKCRYTTYHLSK